MGLFTGAVAGIVRTSTPILFSLVSGAQWFSLGTSYYGQFVGLIVGTPDSNIDTKTSASRLVVEKAWGGRDSLTNAEKIKSSAIAGGFAGMIGGLLRE